MACTLNKISIIIPAHNEASVIVRCLRSVRDAYQQGESEIVVVANNCSDNTAQLARDFGENVTVVETPIGSKVHALNLGDANATSFPRFYVDADIVLEKDSLEKLCLELEKPGVFAVAPLIHVDCSDRPWSVSAYYAVWQQLPYCRTGMIGSGIYGVSEKGRERFDVFPKITADDAYVRLQFAPSERKTVESCRFTVTPPKSITKIVDIKTRSHYGNEELRQQFPEMFKNEEVRHGKPLLRLAANPMWWAALAVYLYVKIATRRRVKQRFQRGEVDKWERDDTSREVVAENHQSADRT